jgi:DNA replication protein DnaC
MRTSDKWEPKAFGAFETKGNATLEKARITAAQWCWDAAWHYGEDHVKKVSPYWLTLAGKSGRGKTFLANLVRKWWAGTISAQPVVINQHITYPDAVLCYWPAVVDRLRDLSQPWSMERYINAPCLILDDIGSEKMTEHVTERLTSLLGQRVGRWTLITTNLDTGQWAEIDTRIASRMIRGSKVVKIEAHDHYLAR